MIRVMDMELFDIAVANLKRLFIAGHPLICACSFGKDSSAVLTIVLAAARQALAEGFRPFIVVTHSDPGIENPEMRNYADREIVKLRAYADKCGLEIDIQVATPALNTGWASRVISGRGMPAFPGGSGDCTTDFKIKPQMKLAAQVFASLKGRFELEPVTLIGTRFEESAQRGRNMAGRGENETTPVRNKSGNLTLSVIANWTEYDVYELVGYANNNLLENYSDLKDMYNLYRDGAGGGCVINFAEKSAAIAAANKQGGGCGSRFGCYFCTKVANDKSLESMVALEPERYGYMKGLNLLREYLIATRWDMYRRMWVGRTITNGWISIQPDSYSPQFCLELLRLSLTLDAREIEASTKLGIKPRFEIISLQSLVLIDATWSLQGYSKPFEAIRVWDEVMNQGKRFDVPVSETYKRPSMPPTRYYFVGDAWDEGKPYYASGLQSTVTSVFTEPGWGGGCMRHMTIEPAAKDQTSFFFSGQYASIGDLPAGTVIGLPSMADVVQVTNDYPDVVPKLVRAKADAVLEQLAQGEYGAVIIPAKKLSAAQKAMARSAGEKSMVGGHALSVLGLEFSSEISVDMEGASLAMMLELDSMLAKNATASDSEGLTEGYRWWTQMGILSVSEGQLRKIDDTLRRTSFKERHGLAGANYNRDEVLAKSVSKAEFFKLSVRPEETAEQRKDRQQAQRDGLREALRGELHQKRVSLAELYSQWSPAVDWRTLMSRRQMPCTRLPRHHAVNKRLVLRHFVGRVALAQFLRNNPEVCASVKAFRTSEAFRQAFAPKKKRGRKAVAPALSFDMTFNVPVVESDPYPVWNKPVQGSLFDWSDAA